MQKKKQGISLIVLVITIIVMIILASAIIISLSNNGVIGKAQEAVNKTNEKQVQEIANLAWAEAYADGKRTQAELEEYVLNRLEANNVDLSNYAINVTTKGVEVVLIPSNWKASVKTIVDGVPIPYGFVSSPYSDENLKDSGLVIYELGDNESGIPEVETLEVSKTTRNQYVWVPVDNFSEFKRKWFESTESQLETEPGGVGYFEMAIGEDNMPLTEQNMSYVSTTTLSEVQAMYASVKKYGGFYVSRYEPGIDSLRNSDDGVLVKGKALHFVKDKYPYTYISWTNSTDITQDSGGAIEVARSIYTKDNSNYGVVSTLIYGVQWDVICNWFLETKTKEELSEIGNYGSTYIKTGTSEATKINNIYDMGGNADEYTMEMGFHFHQGARASRGGCSSFAGGSWGNAVYERNVYAIFQTGAMPCTSFRVALYIK